MKGSSRENNPLKSKNATLRLDITESSRRGLSGLTGIEQEIVDKVVNGVVVKIVGLVLQEMASKTKEKSGGIIKKR